MITSAHDAGKSAHPVTPAPPPADPRLAALAERLARRAPRPDTVSPGAPLSPAWRAAVALVVRPAPRDLELLLIRRAERERDPWSGHMALPGGRAEPADVSLRATAERETHEEVGIDLASRGRWVGELDPVFPRAGAPPVVVKPFVFAVEGSTMAVANAEVHTALWVPLDTLAAATSRIEHEYAMPNGARIRFPALGVEGHVVWGLTYRVLAQFFDLALGRALPESPA